MPLNTVSSVLSHTVGPSTGCFFCTYAFAIIDRVYCLLQMLSIPPIFFISNIRSLLFHRYFMFSSLNAPWVHVPLQVRPLTDFILGKAEQFSRYPAALSPCWYSILAPHLRLAQVGESSNQVTAKSLWLWLTKRPSGSHGLRPTTAAGLSSNRNRNAARRREFITGTNHEWKDT